MKMNYSLLWALDVLNKHLETDIHCLTSSLLLHVGIKTLAVFIFPHLHINSLVHIRALRTCPIVPLFVSVCLSLRIVMHKITSLRYFFCREEYYFFTLHSPYDS